MNSQIEWNDKTFRVGGDSVNADYKYFCRKFENDQALMGSLSDNYFLAAVTSWAKNPKVNHDRVLHFNNNKLSENGCFKFSFFRNGKWNDVFVDRKIPVKKGPGGSGGTLPKYAKWVNPHDQKQGLASVHDFDWWCPLLEKAYAKINGGYEKITTGCSQAVLQGLTGGHALVTNSNQLDTDRLADYCKNYLCTAGNDRHINCPANELSVLNIIKDVELKDNSKVDLVEIRNSGNSKFWTGRFSDSDSQGWSNIVDPNIRCMKLDRRGRMKNVNDGRAFITFEDWQKQFELLRVCTFDLSREDPKPLVNVHVVNPY